jgi:hypothetical protein
MATLSPLAHGHQILLGILPGPLPHGIFTWGPLLLSDDPQRAPQPAVHLQGTVRSDFVPLSTGTPGGVPQGQQGQVRPSFQLLFQPCHIPSPA